MVTSKILPQPSIDTSKITSTRYGPRMTITFYGWEISPVTMHYGRKNGTDTSVSLDKHKQMHRPGLNSWWTMECAKPLSRTNQHCNQLAQATGPNCTTSSALNTPWKLSQYATQPQDYSPPKWTTSPSSVHSTWISLKLQQQPTTTIEMWTGRNSTCDSRNN